MDEGDPSVLDAYHRILSQARRRIVLTRLLGDDDGAVSFEDLVDGVVDAETHSPGPDPESVATTLTHVHLPMLADQGLIEYDREAGVVSTTNRTEQIEPYLAAVGEAGDDPQPDARRSGSDKREATVICPACTSPEGVAEIPLQSTIIGSPASVSPEDTDAAESTQAVCRNCDELFPVYFEAP